MSDDVGKLDLWDDNPSAVDLLGFDAVVSPALAAVELPHLDPLTIGIHAPWGGGKSTILGLLNAELESKFSFVVVPTNPWEYDDQVDVKGTLIAEVLTALEARFGESAGVKEKVGNLLKRISWSRATQALATGALTMQWNVTEIINAFTPKKPETPESMAGFRDAFKELVDSLPDVKRVVVLVDDLDRCLPPAVMATLEAIKLFLSVEKMVFVIAADQDMVRDAIALNLASTPRGERFAQHYLDKIVQLPISLPRLAPHEAEAYIGLLLARHACEDENDFAQLLEHCRTRRREDKTPLLGSFGKLPYKPSEELLSLAGQLAHGLKSDRVTNPREIKRFLNAFGVRQRIAESRALSVRPAVIAKLLLLEDRYRKDFETLAGTPEPDRAALLKAWEDWARGGKGNPPNGISEDSKAWAASEPFLQEEELGPYISLAASLATVSIAGAMSDELIDLTMRLVGSSVADRERAVEEAGKRSLTEQRLILQALFARARQSEDVSPIVDASVGLAKGTSELASDVAQGIHEHCWHRLDPAAAVEIAGSGVAELVDLARQLAADEAIDEGVRQAVRELLQGAS